MKSSLTLGLTVLDVSGVVVEHVHVGHGVVVLGQLGVHTTPPPKHTHVMQPSLNLSSFL